jgi:Protein of unknown function (DUF3515)
VLLIVAGVSGYLVGQLRRDKPVRVTNVPAPNAADAAACRKLSALLPKTIGDGLKPRTVHPASPLLHAWGTPAAVLRCGVGFPPNYPSAGGAAQIDGVVWLPTQAAGATVYTTVERLPRVSLAIPDHYQVTGDLLVSLSAAINKATAGNKPAAGN